MRSCILLATVVATSVYAHELVQTCNLRQHPAMVLKCFVESHPDVETRSRLAEVVKAGKVYLDFNEHNIPLGTVAAFGIHEIPGKGRIWILHLKPSVLLAPTLTKAYKQLVIEHEAEHIFQVLDGDVPAETFLEPASRDRASLLAGITLERVRNKFQAEFAAYQKECDTAIRIGKEDEITLFSPEGRKFSLCGDYKRDGIVSLRKNVAQITKYSLPDVPELAQQRMLIEKLGNSTP